VVSFSPTKCWDSTLKQEMIVPFTSFPGYHSTYILSLDMLKIDMKEVKRLRNKKVFKIFVRKPQRQRQLGS
jgi:hypothetical protein